MGAGDYLTKPFALDELTAVLERAGRDRRTSTWRAGGCVSGCGTQKGAAHLIGRSPEMEKLYRILSKVAYTTHPVLILGESGTGKETGGAVDPLQRAERTEAVHSGGLRVAGADADRERGFRVCEGCGIG